MILSICPNPSVDITVQLDKLNLNAINRSEDCVITYSGKGINVLKIYRVLGGYGCAGGFMFKNDAESFIKEISDLGLNCDFVLQNGDVRKNIKIVENNGVLTEINCAGANVDQDACELLLSKIENASAKYQAVVISGSLPKGCSDSFYEEMAGAVSKDAIKIIDTEGDKLLCALEHGADLIKPNLYELECIFKTKISDFTGMKNKCRELIDKGAEKVLLSLGKDGALITDGARTYFARSPQVEVKSTVGAGDSMIAACAMTMPESDDLREILRAAVASGAAAVTTSGTVPFGIDVYNSIYKKVEVTGI